MGIYRGGGMGYNGEYIEVEEFIQMQILVYIFIENKGKIGIKTNLWK